MFGLELVQKLLQSGISIGVAVGEENFIINVVKLISECESVI